MLSRKEFLKVLGMAGLGAMAPEVLAQNTEKPTQRPNILWLSTEDIGAHLGCYGDPNAITPTLDKLAASGLRYSRAFTTAGVCAPNRSSIITGMHTPSLGTQHMRAGGEGVKRSVKPELPQEIRCFPQYLREAGYFCTNAAKEDYSFITPKESWDSSGAKAHWRNRPDKDQPFFAVFNYTNTHEGSVNSTGATFKKKTQRLRPDQRQNPDKITPPPYHPNTPIVRKQWAKYHELITGLDYWVADFLEQLEEDGLSENTIVFFWSDHGAGVPRCKRWVYDSGTHIPLMVYLPKPWRETLGLQAGTVVEDLVSSVDFGPTVLALAGLDRPDHMQGQPFLASNNTSPRPYVYASRDRMDERYDMIRMVRDERYQYIRNYKPFLPYDQFMNSAEKSQVKKEMRRLAKEEALPEGSQWILRENKPVEELYDTQDDPHTLKNRADDPALAKILKRMRAAHEAWMDRTGDLGLLPEAEMVRLEKRYGNRPAIYPGLAKEDPAFYQDLRKTANAAGRLTEENRTHLAQATRSPHASLRYWAMTGYAYAAEVSQAESDAVRQGLQDPSATVRVAAAQACFAQALEQEKALAVLEKELVSEEEWVRLAAATALDSIGEAARPAIPLLQQSLKDTENKYVVRVANHAINVLLGTKNEVR